MRRTSIDDRWERTGGGLIVPRRPTLPTRRYLQPLGTFQECCLQSAWPSCTFCNHHDDTDSVFFTINGSFSYLSYTWTVDGTYELTTKTAGSAHVMAWSDTFVAAEDGGGPSRSLFLSITFACGADPTPPPLGTALLYGVVYLKDADVWKGRWDSQTIPSLSYTVSGYDDCMTRFFEDYGSPAELDNTTVGYATGYSGTPGAASASNA